MKNGLIEDLHGNKRWYQNGMLHREDGPAIECANGNNVWYQNNKYHRIDGPAIDYEDGTKYWFLNGEEFHCKDNEGFFRMIKLKAFW